MPTDAAFGTSWDALDDEAQDLQPLLLYHLYGSKITPDQVAGKKGPIPTADGNKPIDVDGSVDAIKVNDSVILQADVQATNGVIYVIDKPLTPAGLTALLRLIGRTAGPMVRRLFSPLPQANSAPHDRAATTPAALVVSGPDPDAARLLER